MFHKGEQASQSHHLTCLFVPFKSPHTALTGRSNRRFYFCFVLFGFGVVVYLFVFVLFVCFLFLAGNKSDLQKLISFKHLKQDDSFSWFH